MPSSCSKFDSRAAFLTSVNRYSVNVETQEVDDKIKKNKKKRCEDWLQVLMCATWLDFTEKCAEPLLRHSTESCSSSSKSRADAIRVSRRGRWRKERKADDKIPSKMFILFSKTKEKTNAYGGRGRRDKLLLCDRKQWGLWKTWTSF